MSKHEADSDKSKHTPSPDVETGENDLSVEGIAQIQQDLEKFRDLAMRSQADLDNYRKRITREREEAVRFANKSLMESLLPIIDNFELGLDAARQSGDAKGILSGMEMVSKQLQEFLRIQGVEAIDAIGAPFDPNFHEAVAQEPSEKVPEGSIIRQLRKGYKLRDRLLRPASVVVSKGVESSST